MSKENKLLLAAFFLGLLFFMYLGTLFAFRSRAEAININLKLKLQGNFQAGSRLKIRIDVYDSNSAKVAQFENIPLLYTDSGFFEGMVILEQNLDTSVPYALFIKPQNYLGQLVCNQEKFGSDCQYPEIYLDNSGKLYDLTSTLFYAGDLAPQNGKVDSADFSQIIANYGTNNEIGDINSDGIVNGVDFALAITTLSLNKTDDAINLAAAPTPTATETTPTQPPTNPTPLPTNTPASTTAPTVAPTIAPTTAATPTPVQTGRGRCNAVLTGQVKATYLGMNECRVLNETTYRCVNSASECTNSACVTLTKDEIREALNRCSFGLASYDESSPISCQVSFEADENCTDPVPDTSCDDNSPHCQ
jgi:hypothetical protein